MKHLLCLLLLASLSPWTIAQEVQVNRQNKTIAVTADASAEADAEVAVLAIGYHNFGPTQEAAYKENIRAADMVSKALLGAGIPNQDIETDKLQLGRVDPEEKWSPEMKKERQFEAQQSWHVTLSAARAQAIVDLAVNKGANEVSDVEWDVADPVVLQAKAGAAALAKARRIADQMAIGLGTKLGELVYASNRAPVARLFGGLYTNTVTVSAEASIKAERKPELTLFPRKVKSEATVYAVFAIE